MTRQHIQVLVNDLLELRLVSLDDDPGHRRSALARLAPEGKRAIDRMKRRESVSTASSYARNDAMQVSGECSRRCAIVTHQLVR